MSVINDKLIGSRIRSARIQQGLTQGQVATKLDITEAYWSRVENGKARINLERLYDICQLFELNEMDILEGCCSDLVTVSHETISETYQKQMMSLIQSASPSTLNLMVSVCKAICESKRE